MAAETEAEPVRVLAEGDGVELLAYLVTAARTQVDEAAEGRAHPVGARLTPKHAPPAYCAPPGSASPDRRAQAARPGKSARK
jgi:hypothetical protein